MLFAIVALAGLLSFGSANVAHQGEVKIHPVQEERIISHTIGSVETVNQDLPAAKAPTSAPSTLPN